MNATAELDAVFSAALDAHRAGRLREAQAGYRRVLQAKADHGPALHYLGALAHQAEQHDLAVSLIRQATAAEPSNALYHYNLGEAYRALGRHDDAASCYRQASALDSEWADPHFGLGTALYDQGKLDEAILAYQTAVDLAPDDAEAWSNLGNALMDRSGPGDRAEAERCYGRALEANPDFHDAAVNLGTALLSAKRTDEAIALYRQVLERDERVAAAHYNLGNALAAQRKTDEAIERYQRALSLQPNFPEAHDAMGLAYRTRREPAAAVESFLKAIAQRPAFAEAHHNLGGALVELRRFEDALNAYAEAIRIDPNFADPHNGTANALSQLGRLDEALAAVDRALELDPKLAEAHYTKGLLLEQKGQFEEALDWQRQAVALKPDLSEAHYHMAMSRRAKADEADLARLDDLIADPATTDRQRMNFHFALGKAADDAGDTETAWRHFEAANALKRAEAHFDKDNLEPYVSSLIETFSPEYFAARQAIGDPSEVPVFVLGMPRSGTTLVEQIIASHPAAHGAGELEEMGTLVAALPRLTGGLAAYPDAARLIDEKNARMIAGEYLRPLRARAPEAQRITDKMPGNFLRIGLIAVLFPKARIVHVRRDPLDTCLSCFFQHFGRGHHFSYDLTNLGLYYRQYERLMAHWARVLPGRVFDVRYEDVVSKQEDMSRALIAHCDLPWDPKCLAFHEHERQVRTASFWQVRQPLYASSVGRWRAYETHLGPLKAALGLP